jgi:hypothetical protein
MQETYENQKENTILENIYGTIFYPSETFERLRVNPPIIEGLIITVFVSILGPLINTPLSENTNTFLFVNGILTAGVWGVIKWLSFGGFVELIANVFKNGGKIKSFLTLFGYALLPWIFLGPASLLKAGGILPALIGVLMGIGIWLWSTVLIILAIMKSYQITSGRVMMMILIPSMGGIISLIWFIDFIVTLIQIMKI